MENQVDRVSISQSYSIKMNSYSILNIVAATPLEQFQILPLSAQVYPAAATLTSLEEANLFPQLVGTDLVYATSSCAGSAVTS